MEIFPIHISNPERKKDYYVSKLLTNTKKPIQLSLSDVQWMKTSQTRDGNMILRVFIPPESDIHDLFTKFDDEVFKTAKERNQTWFRNALSEEKLHDFFHSSIDRMHPSLSILCRSWSEPIVYMNDTLISFDMLPNLSVPKDAFIRLLIEPQGLVFQKTRFGIRWVLKKCWISSIMDDDNSDFLDREALEDAWEDELRHLDLDLQRHIDALQNKIQAIQKYSDTLRRHLNTARVCTDGFEWNKTLEGLSKLIAKGQSGLTAFEDILS